MARNNTTCNMCTSQRKLSFTFSVFIDDDQPTFGSGDSNMSQLNPEVAKQNQSCHIFHGSLFNWEFSCLPPHSIWNNNEQIHKDILQALFFRTTLSALTVSIWLRQTDLHRNNGQQYQKVLSLHQEFFLFTARLAKRAKVMFSQAFVCPSPGGGEGGVATPNASGQHLPPPGTRSQHPPPPRTWTWDLFTTPPSPPPPDYAQAGGTHPTGMHSFFSFVRWKRDSCVFSMSRSDAGSAFPTLHKSFTSRTGRRKLSKFSR